MIGNKFTEKSRKRYFTQQKKSSMWNQTLTHSLSYTVCLHTKKIESYLPQKNTQQITHTHKPSPSRTLAKQCCNHGLHACRYAAVNCEHPKTTRPRIRSYRSHRALHPPSCTLIVRPIRPTIASIRRTFGARLAQTISISTQRPCHR